MKFEVSALAAFALLATLGNVLNMRISNFAKYDSATHMGALGALWMIHGSVIPTEVPLFR